MDATAGRVLCQSEVATSWRGTVLVPGCSLASSEYFRCFARWIGCDEGRTGAGSGRTGYNVLMMLHGGWIIIYGSLRRLFFSFITLHLPCRTRWGSLRIRPPKALDISLNQSDMALSLPHFPLSYETGCFLLVCFGHCRCFCLRIRLCSLVLASCYSGSCLVCLVWEGWGRLMGFDEGEDGVPGWDGVS